MTGKRADNVSDAHGMFRIETSHESFLAGLVLYKARADKGYSLTDCISMTTMLERNILQVLTHDRHFKQEGFEILF